MSERLPYESQIQQQLNNLPLPDEDKAWAAMKKMLDEDDDDSVIVIPPPANGCAKWSLLFLVLLLLGGGTWITIRNGWFGKANKQTISKSDSFLIQKEHVSDSAMARQDRPDQSIVDTTLSTQSTKIRNSLAPTDSSKYQSPGTGKRLLPGADTENKNNTAKRNAAPIEKKTQQYSAPHLDEALDDNAKTTAQKKSGSGKSTIAKKTQDKNAFKAGAAIVPVYTSPGNTPANTQTNVDANDHSNKRVEKIDSNTVSAALVMIGDGVKAEPVHDNELVPDSALKQPSIDSLLKTDSIKKATNKLPSKSYFSAGIAMQQQIPLGTASNGANAKFADYIPSVYLRWNNDKKKIFLQSEFKYGAPQYTKEFAYKSIIIKDSFNTRIIDTTYILKKTYYHQLPLSIHYMITPSLSVGAGIMWTNFKNAVSEQVIKKRDFFDSSITSRTLDIKKDTVFSKSVFQFMLEAQYKWKRFSFGARYAQGLQPYIRYTSPGTGTPTKEKNNSLQVFIRYDLWRSKK